MSFRHMARTNEGVPVTPINAGEIKVQIPDGRGHTALTIGAIIRVITILLGDDGKPKLHPDGEEIEEETTAKILQFGIATFDAGNVTCARIEACGEDIEMEQQNEQWVTR